MKVLLSILFMLRNTQEFILKNYQKTLTIPKWLNDMAVREKVNFPQLLQKALKEELHFA